MDNLAAVKDMEVVISQEDGLELNERLLELQSLQELVIVHQQHLQQVLNLL